VTNPPATSCAAPSPRISATATRTPLYNHPKTATIEGVRNLALISEKLGLHLRCLRFSHPHLLCAPTPNVTHGLLNDLQSFHVVTQRGGLAEPLKLVPVNRYSHIAARMSRSQAEHVCLEVVARDCSERLNPSATREVWWSGCGLARLEAPCSQIDRLSRLAEVFVKVDQACLLIFAASRHQRVPARPNCRRPATRPYFCAGCLRYH